MLGYIVAGFVVILVIAMIILALRVVKERKASEDNSEFAYLKGREFKSFQRSINCHMVILKNDQVKFSETKLTSPVVTYDEEKQKRMLELRKVIKSEVSNFHYEADRGIGLTKEDLEWLESINDFFSLDICFPQSIKSFYENQ